MKSISKILPIVCIFIFSFSICMAGSLQPSAPPGPTMKTLSEIDPGTPIPGGNTGSSYVIIEPGRYYLTGNRTFTTQGEGIGINASNVTLDLNGFTFSGTASSVLNGICIAPGYKNIEIRNGTVTGFGKSGIADSNSSNKDIRIINVNCNSNKLYGIYLFSKGSVLKNCIVSENSFDGIYIAGEYAKIENCVAHDNRSSGIWVTSYSTVTGCSCYSNSVSGISAPQDGMIITDNSCHGNGGLGIMAGTKSTIIGNNCRNGGIEGGGVIKNNVVSDSPAFFGIHALTGSTVINNTVQNCLGNGFKIDSSCCVIGNSAYNNGSAGAHCYGFEIDENCLVDQNLSNGNLTNMNTLVNCTVPSGNHAP